MVFTEYFWDMSWCDPCAANPLSTEELAQAGVFWVGGDEAGNFQQIPKSRPVAKSRLRCRPQLHQRRAFFPHAPSRRVVARNR